jgi:AbrB family looped-hinge helix DNA binding protein
MATTVTVKGQVTLPKAVREAAGIRPGDRVTVRARAEAAPAEENAFRQRLEAIARRRPMRDGPFGAKTTDEIMLLLRGED